MCSQKCSTIYVGLTVNGNHDQATGRDVRSDFFLQGASTGIAESKQSTNEPLTREKKNPAMIESNRNLFAG